MTVTTAIAAPTKIYLHSGTGFFIDRDGYILTNEHVLKDCQRITVSGAVREQEVTEIARDTEFDLALLKTARGVPDAAEFRVTTQPVKKGERVVIIGYPGDAAKTGQTVMHEGIVQNTTGPTGETHWLQFSDVATKGNSGGPLMDNTGNVVGVVVAGVTVRFYLNGIIDTGQTQKSSVAITAEPVRQFLNANGMRFRESPSGVLLSDLQVNDLAHRFIVNVRCQYVPKVVEELKKQ